MPVSFHVTLTVLLADHRVKDATKSTELQRRLRYVLQFPSLHWSIDLRMVSILFSIALNIGAPFANPSGERVPMTTQQKVIPAFQVLDLIVFPGAIRYGVDQRDLAGCIDRGEIEDRQ